MEMRDKLIEADLWDALDPRDPSLDKAACDALIKRNQERFEAIQRLEMEVKGNGSEPPVYRVNLPGEGSPLLEERTRERAICAAVLLLAEAEEGQNLMSS
jgi:hypothetical protein